MHRQNDDVVGVTQVLHHRRIHVVGGAGPHELINWGGHLVGHLLDDQRLGRLRPGDLDQPAVDRLVSDDIVTKILGPGSFADGLRSYRGTYQPSC